MDRNPEASYTTTMPKLQGFWCLEFKGSGFGGFRSGFGVLGVRARV